MKVNDIMTQPPQTCRLETDLGLASRRMKASGCGTLVVLDHHGKLAGILTDRDLALALGDTKRNASHVLAHEAMTRKVRSCLPDEDVRTALERMTAGRVRRLPVVTDDGDVKGLISVDDIILWGVQHGGVNQAELTTALRAICAAHALVLEGEISGG